MPRNNYLKLARLAYAMNRQSSSSIPVTIALLKVFNSVIVPEEVDFLLAMGSEPLSKDELSRKVTIPGDAFDAVFSSLIQKGMIWSKTNPDSTVVFTLAPIMLGWFEVYLCTDSRSEEKVQFARQLSNLFESWKKFNVTPIRQLRNMTGKKGVPHKTIKPAQLKKHIEINSPIIPEKSRIMSFASINEVIQKYGEESSIAVVHCFCRQWKSLEGIECTLKMPLESCIVLGNFSRHAVEYGFGRYISKDAALKIIEETAKKGGVHVVWHEQDKLENDEIAICNCCWDCCGVLGSYRRGINSLHFKTQCHVEVASPDRCNACGLCVRFCPVGVISLDDTVTIDVTRCIGCLQCFYKCKRDVIQVHSKERNVYVPLLARPTL